ncbi:hypothetical protein BCVP_CDS0178 [Bacillus phage BC-VP]|nr:hypothetical protein BCVP_CDS0178 [Bacillus phage BC-VP]
MKVNIPKAETREYKVGDIVIPPAQPNAYFIYKSPVTGKYSLLNQAMTSFYTGEFSTLEGLVGDFARWGTNLRHFPKSEYELTLVKKEDVQ